MLASVVRRAAPFSLCAFLFALVSTASLHAASNTVVISQIYTAGGNSGAIYNADYVELFNLSSAPVSLNGWALQYFSATGTGTAIVSTLPAGVTLRPGQHYLVQATPGGTGPTLPSTADYTATNLAMGAAAGRIYLTSSTTTLNGASGCPTTDVVDFIGYGTTAICYESSRAPAPSTTLAIARTNACLDVDNNGTEFSTLAPAPRNSLAVLSPCGATLLTSVAASPSSVIAGSTTLLTAVATSTGLSVTADLSAFNGGSATQPLYDDGTHGDALASDGTYSFNFPVPGSVAAATYTLNFRATNAQLASSTASTSLAVQAPIALTPIHTIQGSIPGKTAYLGQTVLVSGIVTDILSSGFHLQTPDSQQDYIAATSEGIYVFTGAGKVPAVATVGTELQLTGKVALYPLTSVTPGTELDNPGNFTVLSTNNPLPYPVLLDPLINGSESILRLPQVQSMRVTSPTLVVTQPTGGTLTETDETYVSNGQFWAEKSSEARPVREPGLDVRDPFTAAQSPTIPRFDSDAETFLVDSTAAAGGTGSPIDVSTGALLSNALGVLDLSSSVGSPRLILDAVARPTVSYVGTVFTPVAPVVLTPATPAAANEITVGDQNMERFYSSTSSGNGAIAVSPAAYELRLSKASLGIRNVLNSPDILCLEEIQDLATLTDLAQRVSRDAKTNNQPDPQYRPYLVQGNDPSGINVAFLVNPVKVNVANVEQFGKSATFTNADGAQATLNDRPPLVLHAGIIRPGSPDYPLTVIVNHLRSLNGVSGATSTSATVRLKREAQAEYLARLTQGYQAAGEHTIVLGDINAFDVNDGLVDVLGVIRGEPAPPDQDVLPGAAGLVNPALFDFAPTISNGGYTPNGLYTYVFNGYAQSIDHFLITRDLINSIRTAPAHWNADFPVIYRNDATRPEASSDHDGIVGYLTVPGLPSGTPQLSYTPVLRRDPFPPPKGSYELVLTITNTGNGTATNVRVISALLGDTTTNNLNSGYSSYVPDIVPGGSQNAYIDFPLNAGESGAHVVARFTGQYAGGTFGGSIRAVLP